MRTLLQLIADVRATTNGDLERSYLDQVKDKLFLHDMLNSWAPGSTVREAKLEPLRLLIAD